jgi:hypothetical protein
MSENKTGKKKRPTWQEIYDEWYEPDKAIKELTK